MSIEIYSCLKNIFYIGKLVSIWILPDYFLLYVSLFTAASEVIGNFSVVKKRRTLNENKDWKNRDATYRFLPKMLPISTYSPWSSYNFRGCTKVACYLTFQTFSLMFSKTRSSWGHAGWFYWWHTRVKLNRDHIHHVQDKLHTSHIHRQSYAPWSVLAKKKGVLNRTRRFASVPMHWHTCNGYVDCHALISRKHKTLYSYTRSVNRTLLRRLLPLTSSRYCTNVLLNKQNCKKGGAV